MRLGEAHLHTSAYHARLGDAGLFPIPDESPVMAPRLGAPAPVSSTELAVLTMAICDLTDVIVDLTAALLRPPWYVRVWRALLNSFRGVR